MPIPSASDIRIFMQGYCIPASIPTDALIQDWRDNEVIPFIEDFCRTSLTGQKQAIEYYSGTGKDELMLNRRNVLSIDAIRLVSGNDIDTTINIASLELIKATGIIKVKSGLSEYYNYRIFPKGNDNIKVTYSYGGAINSQMELAVKSLVMIRILDHIEGMTGGGELTTHGYNRNYGKMGKYTNIRLRLNRQAMGILRRYSTAVVGS